MIIAVDFDGTICEHIMFPQIGEEKPNAVKTLKRLKGAGATIILWTCRSGKSLQMAKDWLDSRGFVPDKFNENIDGLDGFFDGPKVVADYYFDDRSFPPFPGWGEVADAFLPQLPEEEGAVQ